MSYTLDMEIRDVTTSRREIVGRVAPYDETSYLTGDPRGERLMRGCFRASIAARGDRIPLCIGHNHGAERGAVGMSRTWAEDGDGLVGVFGVRLDERGDEVLADVRDGYLPAMSVGFAPMLARTRRGVDGALEITEAALKEVSLVVVGAYDGAQVLATRAAVQVPDLAAMFPPAPALDLSPYPTPWRV
jgi:HK97 family phage prohead protease